MELTDSSVSVLLEDTVVLEVVALCCDNKLCRGEPLRHPYWRTREDVTARVQKQKVDVLIATVKDALVWRMA